MAWAVFVGRSCGSDYDLLPPQTRVMAMFLNQQRNASI